jgi:prohibitin 2
MVQIQIRVLYKPDINALPFVYRRLNLDFAERVLPSIVNEVAKAVVAQYNASELLTKRDVVSARLREMLVSRAADFHIIFEDISITHLEFSKEYTAAVEAKQVAQQEAERAKYIVDRAFQEKRSIIIKAEGEARAAELIGQAISDNPAFLQLRRIEASKEIANTISHAHGNKVYLDSNVLMLNQLGDATASSLFTATSGKKATAATAAASDAPPTKGSSWY